MKDLLKVLSSFKEIATIMNDVIAEEAKEYALNVPQLLILRGLSEAGSVTMSELCGIIHMSNSSLSTWVEKLVKSKLVEREYSEEDRRCVLLSLTQSGQDKLEELLAVDSGLMKKLMIAFELSHEDMRELLRIHQIIITNSKLGGLHKA